MGESLVEAPKLENKMGESCLQESVSFGRFEHDDSLCWERWSTFPTNKYLDEVEKCSTPGSVAQKKAYFEAHYKRIAARKAELEQEKDREGESVNLGNQSPLSSVCNTSEGEMDVEKPITQKSVELNAEGSFTGEVSDKHIDIPVSYDDVLIHENEVVNLTTEVSDYLEENGVSDLTCEVSETYEDIEVAPIISEVNENIDDSSDAGSVIDEVADFTSEVSEHVNELNDEADVAEEKKRMQPEHIDELHHGTDLIKEEQDIQVEPKAANEDMCPKMDIPELVKSDEPVLVKEDTNSAQVWHDKEVLSQEKVEEREIAVKETKTPVKLADPILTKKPTSVKKATTNASIKNRPASPIPKKTAASMPRSPMVSAPKSSRPELTKTAKSVTRPSVKKENTSAPMTTKKAVRPESKRVLPTSLHMSMSFGPTKADPASVTTMRKSSIMESMGDKDIVRRAFKSFQNGNQLSQSSLVKPTTTNQPATKRTELKASAPEIQKKKEGTIRSAKVTSPIINQQGMRKTPAPNGLKNNVGVDQRNGKAVTASFGSRSQNMGRQQKQVPKKIEPKTTIKDVGLTNLQSKLKAEKAAEIGKPNHNINSKLKLSSSYNQGHGFLRGSVRKENARI